MFRTDGNVLNSIKYFQHEHRFIACLRKENTLFVFNLENAIFSKHLKQNELYGMELNSDSVTAAIGHNVDRYPRVARCL